MGALNNESASLTTIEYVPAVKLGAGPKTPPSTENSKGSVPHKVSKIANPPFV